MSEKKKKGCWQLGGLLPISQPWSRYRILYHDTAGAPGHDTTEQVHAGARNRAAIQPARRTTWPTIRPACVQGRAARERAWPGQG